MTTLKRLQWTVGQDCTLLTKLTQADLCKLLALYGPARRVHHELSLRERTANDIDTIELGEALRAIEQDTVVEIPEGHDLAEDVMGPGNLSGG